MFRGGGRRWKNENRGFQWAIAGVDSFSGSRPEKLNNCKNVVFRVFGEIKEKSKFSWKLVTDGRKNTKTSKTFQNISRKIEFTRKVLTDGLNVTKTRKTEYRNPKNFYQKIYLPILKERTGKITIQNKLNPFIKF